MNDQLILGTKSERLLLAVRGQPRASQNKISGTHQRALKARLTAPPMDSRANLQLLRFLPTAFDCPPVISRCTKGGRSRSKVVVLEGLSEEELLKLLNLYMV